MEDKLKCFSYSPCDTLAFSTFVADSIGVATIVMMRSVEAHQCFTLFSDIHLAVIPHEKVSGSLSILLIYGGDQIGVTSYGCSANEIMSNSNAMTPSQIFQAKKTYQGICARACMPVHRTEQKGTIPCHSDSPATLGGRLGAY